MALTDQSSFGVGNQRVIAQGESVVPATFTNGPTEVFNHLPGERLWCYLSLPTDTGGFYGAVMLPVKLPGQPANTMGFMPFLPTGAVAVDVVMKWLCVGERISLT